MQNQFLRTQLLLGRPAIDTLNGGRVAVFGVGDVGGYVVEVLAHNGVGAIDVIDDDRVCLANVNRQLLATTRTVGKHRVDVTEEHVHSINPRCIVRKCQISYLPDNADQFGFSRYDYVIGCIDTVTVELDLIYRCHEINTPLFSCMDATYKLDATQSRMTDIFKTINDPLVEVIRRKLCKTKIKHLKVVYSPEEPLKSIGQPRISCRFRCTCPDKDMCGYTDRYTIPSSNAWIPTVAGLIAGEEMMKDLVNLASAIHIRSEDEATSEPVRITHGHAVKMLGEHKRLKAEEATANK